MLVLIIYLIALLNVLFLDFIYFKLVLKFFFFYYYKINENRLVFNSIHVPHLPKSALNSFDYYKLIGLKTSSYINTGSKIKFLNK